MKYLFAAAVILLTVFTVMCNQNKNNKVNEMLDKNSFIPDTTFNTHFPWTDVIACFDKGLPSENYKGHDKCPKCGRNSEALIWIEFKSPKWTWENLCGRQGPLSICPKCKIQVEFINEVMN